MRDELAEGVVVCVFVRAEEFDEEVGFGFVAGGSRRAVHDTLFGVCVGVSVGVCRGRGFCDAVGNWSTVLWHVGRPSRLLREEGLLFRLEILWQEVKERLDGLVERKVVDDGEDETDDHEDHRTNSLRRGTGRDSKETDHADHQKIDTNERLLEGTRIHHALGINLHIGDVEHVVSIREVEQIQSDSGEPKDQGGDGGICSR